MGEFMESHDPDYCWGYDQGTNRKTAMGEETPSPNVKRSSTQAGPHDFARMGWRFWLCRHCYAPRSLHPRKGWVIARPLHDHTYLSANAPHFAWQRGGGSGEDGEQW